MKRISRRRFAKWVGHGMAFAQAAAWAGTGRGRAQPPSPIINSFDLSLLDDWLTPNELFFVREHFPAPSLAAEEWKLSVTGAVARPLELGYADLVRRPRRDLPVTLECAGNPVVGGMVSNAEWSGVSLADLLEEARPASDALVVRLWGADGETDGSAYYSRSIPLHKARHPDTLLADRMNGVALPVQHGFPVRAIIPGWYGMDSVKWLREVEVLTTEDTSPSRTERYRRRTRRTDGSEHSERVTAMNVKAAFSRPLDGAILHGRRMVVRGAAWAGEHAVDNVELSADGGSTWQRAQLPRPSGPQPRPYAWVHWTYEWRIPDAGQYELLVRATDDQGRVQPAERAADRSDPNELHHYQKVRCLVV